MPRLPYPAPHDDGRSGRNWSLRDDEASVNQQWPGTVSNGVQVAGLASFAVEREAMRTRRGSTKMVELEGWNGSPNPLRIHRDKLRLLGPNGGVFTARRQSD